MSNKSEQIVVRCTSTQRDRWEQRAAEDKRTLADWIRIQLDEICDDLDARDAKKRDV